MGGVVGAADVGEGQVGVDLGRLQGGVPEQFLDGIDLRSPVEHRCGECVADGVRSFVGGAGSHQFLAHYLIDSHAGHAAVFCAEKRFWGVKFKY